MFVHNPVPSVRSATRTRTLNENAFDVLTPEALYWLGFLYADGCIVRSDSKRQPVLAVDLGGSDIAHLEKWRLFLGSGHKITRNRSNGVVGLQIRSRVLCGRLTQLGLAIKSLNRIPPPHVQRSRDFWRGVVDGDGSIQLRRGVAAITVVGGEPTTQAFLAYMQSVCPRLRARPRRHMPGSPMFSVGTEGQTAIAIIEALYSRATVYLTRKKILADAAIARKGGPERHPFSAAEDNYIKQHHARGSWTRIAATLDRRPGVIANRAKYLRLALPPKHRGPIRCWPTPPCGGSPVPVPESSRG